MASPRGQASRSEATTRRPSRRCSDRHRRSQHRRGRQRRGLSHRALLRSRSRSPRDQRRTTPRTALGSTLPEPAQRFIDRMVVDTEVLGDASNVGAPTVHPGRLVRDGLVYRSLRREGFGARPRIESQRARVRNLCERVGLGREAGGILPRPGAPPPPHNPVLQRELHGLVRGTGDRGPLRPKRLIEAHLLVGSAPVEAPFPTAWSHRSTAGKLCRCYRGTRRRKYGRGLGEAVERRSQQRFTAETCAKLLKARCPWTHITSQILTCLSEMPRDYTENRLSLC